MARKSSLTTAERPGISSKKICHVLDVAVWDLEKVEVSVRPNSLLRMIAKSMGTQGAD